MQQRIRNLIWPVNIVVAIVVILIVILLGDHRNLWDWIGTFIIGVAGLTLYDVWKLRRDNPGISFEW